VYYYRLNSTAYVIFALNNTGFFFDNYEFTLFTLVALPYIVYKMNHMIHYRVLLSYG